MSWNARHSWSVGEILTAANHNNNDSNFDLVWHEVAYNEFTSNVTSTATTEGTATTVVTASAVTFDGSHVALIEFFSPGVANGTSSQTVTFALYDSSSSIGLLTEPISFGANTFNLPVRPSRRLTPSAATKTYSVRVFASSSTTITVHAGAGGSGADMPGYIRILQQG